MTTKTPFIGYFEYLFHSLTVSVSHANMFCLISKNQSTLANANKYSKTYICNRAYLALAFENDSELNTDRRTGARARLAQTKLEDSRMW